MTDYIIKVDKDFNTGENASIHFWSCSQNVVNFILNIFNDSIFNEILKAELKSYITAMVSK